MNNENSLAVIKAAKNNGAMVFLNTENFEAKTELYRTETTLLNLTADDFHNISGKYAPKKETVDRIGEASGVMFIAQNCRVTQILVDDALLGKHTVFHAEAQAKVRLSDGSWRTSSVCDYDFDPTLRVCLEKNALDENQRKAPAVLKQILEYTKFGTQRANTGARLRVIKELTGMPTAFSFEQIKRPMMFGRITQNTSYILNTPEGRAMATAQALGVDMSALFGGRKPELAASESVATTATAEDIESDTVIGGETIPDFLNEKETPPVQQAQSEFERLTLLLEEYMTYKKYLDVVTPSGNNPYKMAQGELTRSDATEESRAVMVKRVHDFLVINEVQGVA